MRGDPNYPDRSVFRLGWVAMSEPASASSGPRRRSGRARAVRGAVLVLALLVTGGVVYGGLRDPGTGPSDGTATPIPTPTRLSSLDLSDLPITRGPFCDALDQNDVETALGGPVTATQHYNSGDRATLATGLADVSHEYNCGYRAANGVQARAWVFAEPVTPGIGRSIARESTGEAGCRPIAGAPRFGTPSAGTLCRATDPAGTAVTLRGLFGDSWLTCQLSTPATAAASDTVRRAEQWCVRVATTMGARP
jgi:hypothetical protein